MILKAREYNRFTHYTKGVTIVTAKEALREAEAIQQNKGTLLIGKQTIHSLRIFM